MKKSIILFVFVGIAIGLVMIRKYAPDSEIKPAIESAKKTAEEETHVKHGENGQVIVVISKEIQGNMGLAVARPDAAQSCREVKACGRVIDPSPLIVLATELAAARAALAVSSRELSRLQTLTAQGNASERALQAAESVAQRDHLAAQSASDRMVWSWSQSVADRINQPGFVKMLNVRKSVLVRLDLPAGEVIKTTPVGARIEAMSGAIAEAEYLGVAASVDPQTLGRGFTFLINTNDIQLLAGEPLAGCIKLSGEPLSGVVVPSKAVVRMEGASWAYIQNSGGDSFTRIAVKLDHPVESGWFITEGIATHDLLVVTGAQSLLSEESKAAIKPD